MKNTTTQITFEKCQKNAGKKRFPEHHQKSKEFLRYQMFKKLKRNFYWLIMSQKPVKEKLAILNKDNGNLINFQAFAITNI